MLQGYKPLREYIRYFKDISIYTADEICRAVFSSIMVAYSRDINLQENIYVISRISLSIQFMSSVEQYLVLNVKNEWVIHVHFWKWVFPWTVDFIRSSFKIKMFFRSLTEFSARFPRLSFVYGTLPRLTKFCTIDLKML